MKTIILAAAFAATCAAIPAYAATNSECDAMWKKADANSDGTLSQAEAMRYSAALRVRDSSMTTDGSLSQASFLEACKSDAFTMRVVDVGAPLKGSNSFTENQAKDRAMAQGISGIGGLTKDADGIWRGPATLDGKAVQVAVDYKGNVVTQPSVN